MAAVTRLGLYGGPRGVYGDFSGKSEQVVSSEATGGGRKRRSKYPRRVMVDGVLHWVRNAEEERQLLQALADRARDAAKTAQALGDEKLARQIKKRSVTLRKRQKAVDSRESEWRARLLAEDEEILLLVD